MSECRSARELWLKEAGDTEHSDDRKVAGSKGSSICRIMEGKRKMGEDLGQNGLPGG